MSEGQAYNDLFTDWSAIQSEFQMTEPEPEEVIFASYTYEDYSGDAVVLYRNGERYCLATGGHCSCYGLEDQWAPEDYDLATLNAALDRGWRPIPDWVRSKLGLVS